jgi:heterodisulfide reductase subunit A2
MGNRKAIYMPFPQAVPRVPVIDTDSCIWFERQKCRACEKLCPTDAPSTSTSRTRCSRSTSATSSSPPAGSRSTAKKIPQYGYGRLANVYTSLEFERLCNAAGPTNGKIVLRDGKTEPKSIAIVHCVGSRDDRHNPYCSGICCMASLKFGHLVLEKTGRRGVLVLHRHADQPEGLRGVLPAAAGARACTSSAARWRK